MAAKTWVGTTGDWGTAGNWSPSGVPADGDEVYFTGASVVSVTSGLTLGGTDDALDELNIHEDYTGSIGTSGGKLIAESITTLRFASRGGKLFVDTDGSGITSAIVTSTAGVADMLEIDGTVTSLYGVGVSGGVTLTAGAAVTNIDWINSPSGVLTVTAGVTGLTLVRMDSGLIKSNAAVSTGIGHILMTGGMMEHTVGAVTLLEIIRGGRFLHTASETITTLYGNGPGATFDGRQNRNPPSVTITNAEAYNKFNLLLKNSMKSYVVTNGVQDFGANVVFEPGTTIS